MTDTKSNAVSEKNEQKIIALNHQTERIERILEKVVENHNQLAIICSEIKIMNETQSKRIDTVEMEHRRAESHRTKALEGIYRKIDESEERNENKIDRSISMLSGKIDDLAQSYNSRIDELSKKVDKFESLRWSVAGGWFVIMIILLKSDSFKQFFSFFG